jgi:hypothetical protein
MSEIWDVEMGYVTNRRGARLHLVIAGGRSYCKSWSGVVIRSRKAQGSDAPNVCKKCREALRTTLVNVLNIRTRRAAPGYDLHGVPGNLSIIAGCEELIEGMMTPAERAERDEMLDTIQRNLRASYEAAIAPKPIRPMATSPESDDQLTLF